MERRTGEPWLKQVQPATLVQPLSHLVQRMITIQNRQDQGFDPTPRRQHMRRVRWDEGVSA